MGQWVFSVLRGDDVRRDPKEAELFKTEHTGEEEYAGNDALVREILQNSVDAGCGVGPIRVRLAIHGEDEAPDGTQLAHYFGRLEPGLASRGIEYMEGRPQIPCRFLVVEDFRTRGLEGDILQFRDPPPDANSQDFYWFWRNIGRSGKTGEDLGRWGLGKTVYRAASRAGCMFGLTVRHSDRQKLLMGQAVLQIHEYGGNEYKPEGYWCGQQDENSALPLPIQNEDELRCFCEQWKLTRTDEPGLSIVCPFIPAELKGERLLQGVAVHFFMRILRGELEVEVVGPKLGAVLLDKEGLADACRKIRWDGPARTKRHLPPPVDFADTCINADPTVTTDVLGTRRVPTLAEEAFPNKVVHQLRQRFSAGELVAVKVRLGLPRRLGDTLEGELSVFVQRTHDGQRCDAYHVREGMTITKINAQAGRRGVRSLVLVDSGPLSEFLGDTEGPAHEDWDQSAERPDNIWQRGWKGRVKFVRRIVDNLVELLTPPSTEPDFDLLIDFFSIEKAGGSPQKQEPGAGSKTPPKMKPVTPVPKWFQITPRSGGFTVSRNNGVPMPHDTALRVAVAYDLPNGNPLKNWSPLDFEVGNQDGKLFPKGTGLEVELVQGNIAVLRGLSDQFHFSVDGFDRHRDLYVRVDEISSSEDGNDAQTR